MKTFLLGTAAAALLGVTSVLPLRAQQTSHDADHETAITATVGLCGNDVWNLTVEDGMQAAERTRVNNPALYRQMQMQDKLRDRANLADIGDTYPFYVRNRTTGELEQVSATLQAEGTRAKIWVDDALLNDSRLSDTKIQQLAQGLETTSGATSRNPNQGCIQNDLEVYGAAPTPTYDDGYIHFLITDIKDGVTSGGAFVAGYFYPYDQLDPGSYPGSNGLNLLYIDIQGFSESNGGVMEVLNTMAHEFQHNIHYNTNPESESFFNEGCSEEASLLSGYPKRTSAGYRAKTNVPLLRWTYDQSKPAEILSDYERAMTFTHYLREQFGEGLLTVLNATRVSGMERLDQALQTYGRNEHWQDVLKGFAVANVVVRNYPDARYTYQSPILGVVQGSLVNTPRASTLKDGTTGSYTAANFPTSGSIDLEGFGIGYLSYSGNALSGGGLQSTFTWNGQAAVYAILYRNTNVVGVRELSNGEPTDLVESQKYTKIIFAVVNLRPGGTNTQVNWVQSGLTSGVDVASAAGVLKIVGITPNPADEEAQIELSSARGGSVELEVFDGGGTSVYRAEVLAEVGHASVRVRTAGLASGAYVVRLRQGGVSATRSLVVAH